MHPKHYSFEDEDYKDWIRDRPCIVCGVERCDPHHAWHANKNDYLSVPLCREHHSECHSNGVETFENKHLIKFLYIIILLLISYITGLKK